MKPIDNRCQGITMIIFFYLKIFLDFPDGR